MRPKEPRKAKPKAKTAEGVVDAAPDMAHYSSWRLRRAGLETSGAGVRVGAVPAAHGSHPGNARVIDGPRSVPKCASGTSRQITTEWHAVRMLSHALYRSIKRSF
jgi:hypothetical protein